MSAKNPASTQPFFNSPQQLPLTDQTDEADVVVQRVRDSADFKYRETKRRKQQEMSHRITEAQRSGDRNRLRNEKKRVDNHASAVASRYKQEYLVKSFDNLVRQKMSESAQLAELVREKDACLARKDMQIRGLSRKVAELTFEVEQLRSHLSTCTTSCGSNEVGSRETWFSTADFGISGHGPPPMDTNRYSHVGHMNEELHGQVVSNGDEHPESSESGASGESVDSALTTLLQAVGTQGSDVNLDLYKIDPAPWEPLQNEVVIERQSLLRSQFKLDKTENCFDPAA